MARLLQEKTKHPQVSLTVEPELRRVMVAEANRQQRSLGSLIRIAVEQYLQTHGG